MKNIINRKRLKINKSKIFFIAFGIFLIITIICTFIMLRQQMDTTVNLNDDFELKRYKSNAEMYKLNNNDSKYNETIKEIDRIESKMKKETQKSYMISGSVFVAGGITVTFLVLGIIFKIKEKRE